MFTFYDPLEQFDIMKLLPGWFFIWAPVTLILALTMHLKLMHKSMSFSHPYQNTMNDNYETSLNFSFWLNKNVYNLICTMMQENMTQKKGEIMLFLYFTFFCILTCNIAGIFPFSYTVTGSFMFMLFFSSSFFMGMNMIGYFSNKSKFFYMFLPGGTPMFIAPLMMLMETISYFSRVFSLAMRLFANMMSGHSLLKILTSFSWNAMKSFAFWMMLAMIPWLVVTAVFMLEGAMAFLQAYVFMMLMCMYINDVLSPH